MRKGNRFEEQINKVIEWINKAGGHAHKNNPQRTLSGVYIKGEPFDYEIFYKDYYACFDAKEVQGDTWHLLKKDIVQVENLKHCKNCNLKAYFLIFNKGKVKQLDVDVVLEELKKGKKSIKLEKLRNWDLLDYIKEEV